MREGQLLDGGMSDRDRTEGGRVVGEWSAAKGLLRPDISPPPRGFRVSGRGLVGIDREGGSRRAPGVVYAAHLG